MNEAAKGKNMLTPLTGAAVGCDLVGTALVLLDLIRSRRNAKYLSDISDYITALEVSSGDIQTPKQADQRVPADDILDILADGARGATLRSKKTYLAAKKKIDKAESLHLGYIALGILIVGILLHGAEALHHDQPASKITSPSTPSEAKSGRQE